MSHVADGVVAELARLLDEHYPAKVLAEIPPSTARGIAAKATAMATVDALVRSTPAVSHAVLALHRAHHGDLRGEQVRRSAILDGLGDVEPGLRRMVEVGLAVLRPAPGQRDWSLEEEIESRRYLQRELLIPEELGAFLSSLVVQQPGPTTLEVVDHDVAKRPGLSVDALELNLLHLTTALGNQALLLNKDLTPNRRSLRRFVKGLRLPGNHRGDAEPGRPEVFEPVYFLMAMALSLGLAELAGEHVRADTARCERFFASNERERNRKLLKAYRFCNRWNEVEAARVLHTTGVLRDLEIGRRGVLGTNAAWAKLGGARGQVCGDLHKLNVTEWSDVDETIALLTTLDRGYLARTLEQGAGGPAVGPRHFLTAMLTLTLPWLGIGECGTWVDPQGRAREVFRLTPRGLRILADKADETEAEISAGRALLVQPNLEVTVFLDYATLAMLQDLYRIAERVSLAERVAVFRLTAETVQRGFGQGAEPSAVIEFLDRNARAPVPESVKFSVRDWERIQRKITLYARGALLRNPDPDALYDAVGTLSHYWGGEPAAMPDSTSVFLPGGASTDFACFAELDATHVIDYAAAPPPCFRHAGGMELHELPCGLDMVTAKDVAEIATREARSCGATIWTLEPARVAAKWAQGGSQQLLDFLEPRLETGLTPKLELLLLAALKKDIRAEIRTDVIVITTSDEMVCDALLEVREIEARTIVRLGPAALLVPLDAKDSIAAILTELGLH